MKLTQLGIRLIVYCKFNFFSNSFLMFQEKITAEVSLIQKQLVEILKYGEVKQVKQIQTTHISQKCKASLILNAVKIQNCKANCMKLKEKKMIQKEFFIEQRMVEILLQTYFRQQFKQKDLLFLQNIMTKIIN